MSLEENVFSVDAFRKSTNDLSMSHSKLDAFMQRKETLDLSWGLDLKVKS